MKKIRVGTRGSRLALTQTEQVIKMLKERFPEAETETVIIKSTGDRIQDRPLAEIGSSGLFTRELEAALLEGTIDFAVHSMKDMPVEQPAGLVFSTPPAREDCRDALVLRPGLAGIADLPRGAKIGTGSSRRARQLALWRPDLRVVGIRGNIETRMRKIGELGLDGVILAAAGLRRGGYEERISAYLAPELMTPAPAQGVLAIEYRAADKELGWLLAALGDKATEITARAERAFLKACGAGCHAPVGAFCRIDGESLELLGVFGEEAGEDLVRGSLSGTTEAPEELGFALAEKLMAELRKPARQAAPGTAADSGDQKNAAADSGVRDTVGTKSARPQAAPVQAGFVSLVGAGPGDPGLITVKGREALRSADCVIYDLLANTQLLEEAPAGCEKIYAGKKAGSHSLPQEEITELIVSRARRGGRVVRLKGGDPYVFGRGGEEALRLAAEGIPFEVVPGVTAPIGGLCYAGIPITHRGRATSFHVVTAHTREGGIEPEECAWLAKTGGTLVFMMGLGQAQAISRGLLAGGMAPETPAAVISKATTPEQQTLVTTVAGLPQALAERPMAFPAMIAVGQVVGLRDELSFVERRPLFGKRVLVTRAAQKGGRLSQLLREAGAAVLEAPVQELTPCRGALAAAMEGLKDYQYIVFTSAYTVELFFQAMREAGLDARALSGKTLCAVGRVTAESLESHGLKADIAPAEYTAEALYALLADRLLPEDRVLLPQSAAARPYLKENLASLCRLEVIEAYAPRANEGLARLLAGIAGGAKDNAGPSAAAAGEPEAGRPPLDAAVFTSTAGVEGFLALPLAETLLERAALFSIGPLTSASMRKHGLIPIESRESTMESLVEALLQWAEKE